VSKDHQFCDHCSRRIKGCNFVPVSSLPVEVSAAGYGESATLCPLCWRDVLRADALMEKAHAIMERAAQRGPKPWDEDQDGRPGIGTGVARA